MNTNVYAYYHKVPGIDAGVESELIALWHKSWAAQGWTPLLLSHPHAAAHARYREYDQHTRRFPSVNFKEYERSCFLRWLALARVGGGLQTDYDVINRNFRPVDLALLSGAPPNIFDRGRVPCAVYSTAPEQIVDKIMSTAPNYALQQQTDMTIFQTTDWPHGGSVGAEFGDSGWEDVRFVHFAHSSCNRHAPGQKRADVIRREMKL